MLDIGFGAQLWVDNAFDSRFRGALAQSDIQTFFDTLLAAALRLQLCSHVYLTAGGLDSK